MRGAGILFVVIGAVLALIAGAWGHSGFYESQALMLLVLALAALGCLGAGLGMLRYQRSGLPTAREVNASMVQRAFAPPSAPAPIPAKTPTVAPPPAPEASIRSNTVDETTRDRPARTTEWCLLLPDGTSLPIADALVIGRQPVSPDGGPTAAVPSPEVSKSHARFQILDGRLLVRDLDSTNGTVIVHPDQTESSVSSSAETWIGDGDRLEIGSYVLTVERRP